MPTTTLRSKIGHTSPELFAAFPRSMGLTAAEAVGTGFEGIFARRSLNRSQRERVQHLLDYFADALQVTRDRFVAADKRLFAHFTPSQQALLLFLRAIVGRPELLILDEPSQGMDEAIWSRCCQLLDQEWRETPSQAVIVVSHYEDEVRHSVAHR